MGYKDLIRRVHVSLTIDKNINNRLRYISSAYNMPKGRIVDIALNCYFANINELNTPLPPPYCESDKPSPNSKA